MKSTSAVLQDQEISKIYEYWIERMGPFLLKEHPKERYPEQHRLEIEREIDIFARLRFFWELFSSQQTSFLTSKIYKGWCSSGLIMSEALQKSSSISSHIETLLNRFWHNHIKIPQREEVYNYLICYPDLADILPLICNRLRERFVLPAEISIEMYHDPEIEYEYLTLYVRLDSYYENVMDEIEEVCAEYEAERSERSGWLLITTDFRPPG